MPFRDPAKCLRDIVIAIELIDDFVGAMSREEFRADKKTEAAVERELQIVSEAAYRLGKEADVLCPGVDWSGIRGFGNFLRHEYDNLDRPLVWQIITEELPSLKTSVETALGKLP